MLFEKPSVILARQAAARCWLEAYAEKNRTGKVEGRKTDAEKAIAVIVLTHKTSDYLAQHDPQALKQAQQALDKTSWENFLGQLPTNAERGFG